MAIITKNSQVATKQPSTADLQVGQLGVNTADGVLYTKHSDNTIKNLTGVKLSGDQTITGVKTFIDDIVANVTGNAGTATNLQPDASVTRLNATGTGNTFGECGVELYGNGVTNTVKPSLGFHQPGMFAGTLQQSDAYNFKFLTILGYLANLEIAAGVTANQAVTFEQVIGLGQTWQDVTASRASGVTYTNSTGKPIFVSISETSNNVFGTFTVNGIVVANFTTTDNDIAMSAIVPNGGTYVLSRGITIMNWSELR